MTNPVIPSLKTFPTWGDANYTTRDSNSLGAIKGAAAVAKFVTYCNMYLYSATCLIETLGTSTYSSTKSSQSIQFTVVVNTSTVGTTVSLATTTWGPYALGGPTLSTATGTGQVGGVNYFAFNTNTGLAGQGGYYVPQGSEVIATLGTDATASVVVSIDFQQAPLAAVTA